MKVERIRGDAPVEEVQGLSRLAFATQAELTPPSGALAETAETVAADFATHGGLLLRDDDGRLLATCRVRRDGTAWVLRRCAVDPTYRRGGVGRRLVEEAHAWAAEEGALRTHIGVRHALTGSRRFWERVGYQPLGERAFYTELVRPLPVVLHGSDETFALGERLAADLRPGDLLLLSGPLGAGKTALTQGIGAGLGVRGAVTSPTFVLARVHRGPLPLVHVDAYRLRDSGSSRLELDDLDLDASLEDSVTVVEWGEGLVEGLADARLEIRIERPSDDARTVVVLPHGLRWSVFS
ncbi:MAG: ATPase or kinase [Frankiales bacterium]|jgi:tRNA threonylcarbamoyladenosine biosynthesis protein TsaE|nr:ATPase or kinase [Frankiales bacterium]